MTQWKNVDFVAMEEIASKEGMDSMKVWPNLVLAIIGSSDRAFLVLFSAAKAASVRESSSREQRTVAASILGQAMNCVTSLRLFYSIAKSKRS